MSHWDALRLNPAPKPRATPPTKAADEPTSAPLSVEELARGLPPVSWEDVLAKALGNLATTLQGRG